MTWDEAKNYVASLPLAETIDEARLRESYEPCRAAVERLPTALIKNPEIKAMPSHLSKQLARLAASDTFLNLFGGAEWQFAMVEIDSLIAFQRELVLDNVHAARRPRGAVTSRLLDYCLPLEWTSEFQVTPAAGNSISFSSWDPNLGLNVAISPPVASFQVSLRPPYIQVADFGGRLLLKNGYHRTFWLKKSGYRHVPCVLIKCHEYTQTGASHPAFFPQQTVLGPRPPLVRYFVDENLTATFRERRAKKVITLNWQEHWVPI